MTGEGTVDTAVKAMKIGALDYIVKPFKAATLLPILDRAIESRQLRLQNARLEAALRERVEELGWLNTVLDAARRGRARQPRKSTFLSSMSHELHTAQQHSRLCANPRQRQVSQRRSRAPALCRQHRPGRAPFAVVGQ
jgi:FixJ family two-component response regulator